MLSTQKRHTSPVLEDVFDVFNVNNTSYSFVELGCGLGIVSRHVKRLALFREVIGVDVDAITLFLARLANIQTRQIQFIHKDIFQFRYEFPAVYYCYFSSEILAKLYQQGLLDGKLVITLTFQIQDAKAHAMYSIDTYQKTLYVYDFRKLSKK